MIVTAIALAVVAIAALVTLIWTLDKHEHEREQWAKEREQWAKERKQLVDRAIARHAGEVVALGREPKPKVERDPASIIYTEGLT